MKTKKTDPVEKKIDPILVVLVGLFLLALCNFICILVAYFNSNAK